MSGEDLHDIQDWAVGLLARLKPAERKRVNRAVSMELRRAQSSRIGAQQNPDGTAYEPRRQKNLRGKRGSIRRKMFQRLRTARFLRAEAYPDAAVVGFTGNAARIALVHQRGLLDSPGPKSRAVRYAVRQLIGFSSDDRERIFDAYARHLAGLGL